MNGPSHPLGPLSEDEQRLIRLFRCFDNDTRSETLQRLGKRLMMEAAVDLSLSSNEKPEQAVREELHDEIDHRLKRLWPVHFPLLDLLDYDFDVTQEGWQEASIPVANVILGSGQNDDDFADMLLEAYLEGAKKYDTPLPCDFADMKESKEEAVQAMRQDLHREALTFIKDWRENVIRRFEQGP